MGDLLGHYKTFFAGNSKDLMENKHPNYTYRGTYLMELLFIGVYIWSRFDIGDRLGLGNCEQLGNCFDGGTDVIALYLTLDALVRLGNKYINGYDTSKENFNSPGIIGTIKETTYYGNRN